MKTVTKNLFGAAMLIGSALAIAMPASAQPNYGFYPGGGGYGSYGSQGYYGNQGSYGNRTFAASRGYWRWDARLHRRVWVPARLSYWRGGYDRGYDRFYPGGGYRGR